jgi:hypothetical protein
LAGTLRKPLSFPIAVGSLLWIGGPKLKIDTHRGFTNTPGPESPSQLRVKIMPTFRPSKFFFKNTKPVRTGNASGF